MIKEISFKEYFSRMEDLFDIHWEEIATNKESRKLNVDKELFFSLEEKGLLITLGAFEEEVLVGYSVNILSRDTHDCTKVLFINDALFIRKENRKGKVGYCLIKETEQKAKEKECYAVVWHAKPNSSLDILLDRLGYEIKDFLYMKEV